jgi:hypothetical protein
MVNFDVLTIGLEVEFLLEENVYGGIVRYKGPLNGHDGMWVGVEAKEPSKIRSKPFLLLNNQFFQALFLTKSRVLRRTIEREDLLYVH